MYIQIIIITYIIGGSESNAAVLASLSTALHLDKKPVVGQVRFTSQVLFKLRFYSLSRNILGGRAVVLQ